jgi:hypothetical protein
MKFLRYTVIALFLVLCAFMAVKNPIVGAVALWMGCLAISEVQSPYMAAVSVPSGLKLDRILNTAVIALQRRLLPLMAFSTVFRDVVLSGTDTVQVPFVPLQQVASTDFVQATGYVAGDGTLLTKPIVVNKRKYQTLSITSYQLARNPIIELEQIIIAKVNQLAEDVIADIFTQVTPTNFPTVAFTGASSTFDSDSIVACRKSATDAMWPETDRSIVLNTTYDAAALQDNSIKNAFAFGDRNPIGEGLIRRILGFDYFPAPVLPGNAVNLVGFTALKYALLTAFSPIEPTPAVRSVMVDYRQATHEQTGLTLEYRLFGSAQGDVEQHIIEVNYGSGLGDPAQLQPIVSA